MAEIVTLQLPDPLAAQIKEIAARRDRTLEEILMEWIDHAIADLPIESLPDDQLLALCDLQMPPDQQEQLSELLANQREGHLHPADQTRLDHLMQVYRQGLVRKAKAMKAAVDRGLRPSLDHQ